MLHIITGTQTSVLDDFLNSLVDQDTLVFTDRAFYNEQITQLTSVQRTQNVSLNVFCVQDKPLNNEITSINKISYVDFILLCETHASIKTWY